MKIKLYIVIALLCSGAGLQAQQGMWVWVKGDSVTSKYGSYGTVGVPSVFNEPKGRYASSRWTDTAGNFWMSGGGGNDLWKFDPNTALWTWMAGDSTGAAQNVAAPIGSYSALNNPGNVLQGQGTWITRDNHLWLMGNNTLWQFDPVINQWASMGPMGPTNYGVKGVGSASTLPGTRTETATLWVDTVGNLWMFGGDLGGANVNDMWKYDMATGIWTWMSGTNVPENGGNYGTLGVPGTFNIPPARSSTVAWTDVNGNFWLSGGEKIAYSIYYEDIWMFNPQTVQWTWVGGPAGGSTSGPAGVDCDTSTSNNEGLRWENRAMWKLCDDIIINYSGSPIGNYSGSVNDLWAYFPFLNEWMKISSSDSFGSYGTKGYASPTNYPPARVGPQSSVDKHHNLWMFGGATVRGQQFNDLWVYIPDSACLQLATCLSSSPVPPLLTAASVVNTSCSSGCQGSATVAVTLGKPPYHYYWLPGADTTPTISNLCSGTYQVMVLDDYGDTSTQSVTVTSLSSPVVTIAPGDTMVCPGDSVQICAPGGFAIYAWNQGGSTNCITATSAGNYYVTVTDANNCSGISNHASIGSYQAPPVTTTQSNDTLVVYNTTRCQWYLNGKILPGETDSILIAQQNGLYTVVVYDSTGCSSTSNQLNVKLTGIDNLSPGGNVSIYPNPAQAGGWNLFVNPALIGSAFEIFDSEGRMVYKNIITQSLTNINPPLAEGVYLLRIHAGNEIIIRKVVKI